MLGGAIAGGVGQIIGGIINRDMQRETNWESREASREQMNFQKGMSDTAHQREVQDLIAAGLNPVLSAGGAGASTPSGASPSLAAPKLEFPNFFEAVSTAIHLNQEQQKIELQKKLTEATLPEKAAKTGNIKADTRLKQKGTVRADVEGRLSEKATTGLEWLLKKAQDVYKNSTDPSIQRDYNRNMRRP